MLTRRCIFLRSYNWKKCGHILFVLMCVYFPNACLSFINRLSMIKSYYCRAYNYLKFKYILNCGPITCIYKIWNKMQSVSFHIFFSVVSNVKRNKQPFQRIWSRINQVYIPMNFLTCCLLHIFKFEKGKLFKIINIIIVFLGL